MSVYDKIFSELSLKEIKLLQSFKDGIQNKISNLGKSSGMYIKTLSVYRDRLLKKGIIKAPIYGYLELSLPRFSDYLKTKTTY